MYPLVAETIVVSSYFNASNRMNV